MPSPRPSTLKAKDLLEQTSVRTEGRTEGYVPHWGGGGGGGGGGARASTQPAGLRVGQLSCLLSQH